MGKFDMSGKVVIEFYGTGCLNCQMMTPIINQLEHDFPDIRFYRVNADQYPNLIQKYHITSLPTLLMFRQGQMLPPIVGIKPLQVMQRLIDQTLNYA
ncbi:MAG: thioredoxin family protein [Prevotella sp.]|nr:thioredoxin family protein [Prevotella sp.]